MISIDFFDVLDGFQVRGDASVDRDEFVIDDAGEGEEVKRVHQHLVGFLVVFVETWIRWNAYIPL